MFELVRYFWKHGIRVLPGCGVGTLTPWNDRGSAAIRPPPNESQNYFEAHTSTFIAWLNQHGTYVSPQCLLGLANISSRTK